MHRCRGMKQRRLCARHKYKNRLRARTNSTAPFSPPVQDILPPHIYTRTYIVFNNNNNVKYKIARGAKRFLLFIFLHYSSYRAHDSLTNIFISYTSARVSHSVSMAVAGEPTVWWSAAVGVGGRYARNISLSASRTPTTFRREHVHCCCSRRRRHHRRPTYEGWIHINLRVYSFVLYYFISHYSFLALQLFHKIIIFRSVLENSFWSSAVIFYYYLKIINNDYRVYIICLYVKVYIFYTH